LTGKCGPTYHIEIREYVFSRLEIGLPRKFLPDAQRRAKAGSGEIQERVSARLKNEVWTNTPGTVFRR
jgi:hypothetical protein